MAAGPAATRAGVDRALYGLAAVAAGLIAFIGFAQTYYLKGLFGTPALPLMLHVHGLVMTGWVVLFVVQTRLVAAHRVDMHRRLGMFGALLAVLVVAVGVATGIEAARRGFSPGPPPLVFLMLPISVATVFAVLFAAGLALRRRSDFHKRLMLLATLSLLTPAIARIPLEFIHAGGPPVIFGLTNLLVIACIVYDTVRNRRLHPAFGWGALFFLATQPLRIILANTPAWLQFAGWLVA